MLPSNLITYRPSSGKNEVHRQNVTGRYREVDESEAEVRAS